MDTQTIAIGGGLVFVVAMVVGMATPEQTEIAGPFAHAELTTITYDVSGSSLSSLQTTMQLKGPRGHWGYARTRWNWDADCNMRFTARITIPKLVQRGRLTAEELATWDRMITTLTAHEMNHVEIGRGQAAAIKEADCDEAEVKRINREWKYKNSDYDRRTDHGRTEGVHLSLQ